MGFGPTKSLAKVANRLAKKNPGYTGVCVLDSPESIEQALSTFPVEDLWGVGYRYIRKDVEKHGLETALDFRNAPDNWIAGLMTVNGLRLAHELRGYPCRQSDVSAPPEKKICAAPSFGRVIPYLAMISDALTNHLTRACEKLRKQDSLSGSVIVFLHTNRFRNTPGRADRRSKQYSASRTVILPHPTNSTVELLRYARNVLTSIFVFGYHFQTLGLVLSDLVPGDYRQKGVSVDGPDERLLKLARMVDAVNYRHGQDKLRLASQLYNPDRPVQPTYLSRRYTTRWEDIVEVS